MNLRILKKLSKRAHALMLEGHGQKWYGSFYPAMKWDSHTDVVGHDRKHWERGNACNKIDWRGRIYWTPRNGKGHSYMNEPDAPLKGTMMLGQSVGYYEPEWEEATCWERFESFVRSHFEDYIEIPGTEDESGCPEFDWVRSRQFKSPAQIFRAFNEGLHR